jgi:hypothetical protein
VTPFLVLLSATLALRALGAAGVTVLDERIAQADENVALFRREQPGERTRTLMAGSAFACAACHQQ